jgi:hypothetical protein
MSSSANLKNAMPRIVSAIIVTAAIACATPVAALAAPPDPCHSFTPIATSASATAR